MSYQPLPPLSIPHLPSTFQGTITLDGSKSITNRALIILSLAGVDPLQYIVGSSTSKDTQTLLHLLSSPKDALWDAGDAGTTFRFLAAFLALKPGEQVLTGTSGLQARPIGPLVDALQQMGVPVEYLQRVGFPPIRVGTLPTPVTGTHQVTIQASISSQFVSALLLIAPMLPDGLELTLEGQVVSNPYIELTLHLMSYFGAQWERNENTIRVLPVGYQPKTIRIEADWSAASYWYSFVALATPGSNILLRGLYENSWQGDAILPKMMEAFGVETNFGPDGVLITKAGATKPFFEWDFNDCPDLAQTLAVTCAASGVQGLFSGLETLKIKETDRIAALKKELSKVGVSFVKLPPHFNKRQPEKTYYMVEGSAQWDPPLSIETYHDHRMAMSCSALALLGPLQIEQPDVVKKSYPSFWQDLNQLFFPSTSP
jgi:3-phosphoshikimate 1-carboxyvinyltransferase